MIAEYALSDNSKPIGVAEYQFNRALPAGLKDKLPSIKKIEAELADKNGAGCDGYLFLQLKKSTCRRATPTTHLQSKRETSNLNT